MRTQSSIKNLIFAMAGQSIGLLVSFVARIAFVRVLSTEYLGLNGLFTTILSLLSLVELGVGPAMTFSLYKPLAEKDTEKVKSLMQLYKKAYTVIGIVVAILGASLAPFLHFFIKDIPDIPNIYLIYLLFVANSAISYFFSYKRSLIITDQKRYIATYYRYTFFTVLNIVQIIVLFSTKSFILFLSCQVIATVAENIFISKKADKLYPFLKEKTIQKLDKETTGSIFKNIRALVVHKLGGVVVNSTDNLIISRFVGLTWVGLYSNYFLVINALNLVIAQIFSSITASVGNLGVTETKEKTKSIFDVVFFLNFWIYGFCSIAFIAILNPFIQLWLGEKYLLSDSIVIMIVLNFYLTGMRQAVLTFKEAMGLFWYDRHKPIFESIINLCVSLILVKYLGMVGVFIGTTISTLTTCFWIEPYVLYKHGLKFPLLPFFLRYIFYMLITIITSILTLKVSELFYEVNFINFIFKVIICIVIPNIIFLIIFHKTTEFKFLYKLLNNFVFKKIRNLSTLSK
ncbi:sugar translocase [Priestia megaterium]|uniref:lipopolysaccharide biosynthesis protein n=2 Tax=Priestia megaterium TaxID=1404 RepID=UPI0010AD36E9|nr:oligosaccharide flippase family protein [Priestia megaterium]TJZ35599.1 sugar translocase [Priestia megaterium]